MEQWKWYDVCIERSYVLSRWPACQAIKGLFTVPVKRKLGKKNESTSWETGRFTCKSCPPISWLAPIDHEVDSPTQVKAIHLRAKSIFQLGKARKILNDIISTGTSVAWLYACMAQFQWKNHEEKGDEMLVCDKIGKISILSCKSQPNKLHIQ